MEDSKIIELYFSRSEQAIRETEKRYGAYLGTIAYNILRNREDAEESVNDTYLETWNSIPPRNPGCLQAFLGKLTRLNAIDRWRRRTARKRGGELELALEELGDCFPAGDSPERALEQAELTRALEQFLSALPVQKRRLFLLRYWYMLSIRELAQRTGWTETRVKTTLHRIRRQLRGYLQEKGVLE